MTPVARRSRDRAVGSSPREPSAVASQNTLDVNDPVAVQADRDTLAQFALERGDRYPFLCRARQVKPFAIGIHVVKIDQPPVVEPAMNAARDPLQFPQERLHRVPSSRRVRRLAGAALVAIFIEAN